VAEAEALKELVFLDLNNNAIDEDGASALAAAPLLELAQLGLRFNRIGPAGAMALARSSSLRELTRLDLSVNPIGDEAQRVLRERFDEGVSLDV
jgi:hypothetical protein